MTLRAPPCMFLSVTLTRIVVVVGVVVVVVVLASSADF
jgi:hypothetical protein